LIAKRGMALLGVADPVLLGKTSRGNDDITHKLASVGCVGCVAFGAR
jgi:hypothetical protein